MTTTVEKKLSVDELTAKMNEIRRNLSIRKTELEEDRLMFRRASYDVINGKPGAKKELETYRRKMNEAQEEIETLSASLEVAEEQLEIARAEEREAKYQAQLEKAERLISERKTATAEVDAAIKTLGAALGRADKFAGKLFEMNRRAHHPLSERERTQRFIESLYAVLPNPYRRLLKYSPWGKQDGRGFQEREEQAHQIEIRAHRQNLTGFVEKSR